MIENVHERVLRANPIAAGALIDSLASQTDLLWPLERWPAMRFEDGLRVGAWGGHGPVRYRIQRYEPARSIVFEFGRPTGFRGTHGFALREEGPGTVRLIHALRMEPVGWARVTWPLFFRPLHDALLEDALDRAEAWAGRAVGRRRFSLRVRALRWAAGVATRIHRQRGRRAQNGRVGTG